MGIFRVSEQEKLKLFRYNFRQVIKDGQYPPERQRLLFNWCQRNSLDWNKARAYVLEDAIALAEYQLKQILADKQISAEEVQSYRHLKRRLALSDEEAKIPRLNKLLIEKIKTRIIERAAYIGAAPAVQSMKDEIQSYGLPDAAQHQLIELIERQHALGRLTSGRLPVIQTHVPLYKDEACHYETVVSFLASKGQKLASGEGFLLVTSQRLMIRASSDNWSVRWAEVIDLRYRSELWFEIRIADSAIAISHSDVQYIATLISSAIRVYNPAMPVPIHPGKRLA